MKIEIQNLGPIHHFEFDLEKDLHLLYGENNVGKSFAVNVVYSFLKNLYNEYHFDSLRSIGEMFTTKKMESSFKSMLTKFTKLKEGEEVSINEFVKTTVKSAFNEIILVEIEDYFDSYLRNLDSIKNIWTNEKPTITLYFEKCDILVQYSNYFKVQQFDLTDDFKVKLVKSPSGEVQIFSLMVNNELSMEAFNWQAILGGAWGIVITDIQNELKKIFEEIYFLPSSRSGLLQVLENMSGLAVGLSQSRIRGTNRSIGIPTLSESNSDFFTELSNIDTSEKTMTSLGLIADRIELSILKGKVSYNDKKKKLYYSPINSNLKLELTETASFISEIAPLVAYIRHILQVRGAEKSLLIIEEPEAHLHPKVQVQLMEIFAELTKHNVKVILTSHSNYMFNQLSNMLLKKDIAPEKVAVYHMVMTGKGSIVKPDMQATEEGIEDHNFAGVAQQLYQERLESYEALNEDTDATK